MFTFLTFCPNLIGFAKYHNYNEKHAAFVAESKEKRSSKRGRNVAETHSQFDDPDDAIVDRAVCKIAKAFESYKGGDAPNDNDNDATNEDTKPKSGAGSTFGRGRNQFGGKRG